MLITISVTLPLSLSCLSLLAPLDTFTVSLFVWLVGGHLAQPRSALRAMPYFHKLHLEDQKNLDANAEKCAITKDKARQLAVLLLLQKIDLPDARSGLDGHSCPIFAKVAKLVTLPSPVSPRLPQPVELFGSSPRSQDSSPERVSPFP